MLTNRFRTKDPWRNETLHANVCDSRGGSPVWSGRPTLKGVSIPTLNKNCGKVFWEQINDRVPTQFYTSREFMDGRPHPWICSASPASSPLPQSLSICAWKASINQRNPRLFLVQNSDTNHGRDHGRSAPIIPRATRFTLEASRVTWAMVN